MRHMPTQMMQPVGSRTGESSRRSTSPTVSRYEFFWSWVDTFYRSFLLSRPMDITSADSQEVVTPNSVEDPQAPKTLTKSLSLEISITVFFNYHGLFASFFWPSYLLQIQLEHHSVTLYCTLWYFHKLYRKKASWKWAFIPHTTY